MSRTNRDVLEIETPHGVYAVQLKPTAAVYENVVKMIWPQKFGILPEDIQLAGMIADMVDSCTVDGETVPVNELGILDLQILSVGIRRFFLGLLLPGQSATNSGSDTSA